MFIQIIGVILGIVMMIAAILNWDLYKIGFTAFYTRRIRVRFSFFATGLIIFYVCFHLVNPFVSTSASNGKSIIWLTDYNEAKKMAKECDYPIIVYFYTNWCSSCKKMERTTYVDTAVVEQSRQFICVKVNANENHILTEQFDVHYYPTLLLLRPDTSKLGVAIGYGTAAQFLSFIESGLAKLK